MSRTFANSTSDYCEAAAGIVTAAPVAISAQVYCTATSTSYQIANLGNSGTGAGTNSFQSRLRGGVAGDPLSAITGDSSAQRIANSTNGYSTSTLHHTLCNFAAANSREALIDGTGSGTETTSATPSGINRFTVGLIRQSSNFGPFIGDIQNVGLFNAAITDSNALAALGAGMVAWKAQPANCVGWWPLWGSSPEPDVFAQANNLTVSGTSVGTHHRMFYDLLGPAYVAKRSPLVGATALLGGLI